MGLVVRGLPHLALVGGDVQDLEVAPDVASFVAALELAVVDQDVGVLDFLDLGLVDVGRAVPG